MKIAAIVPLKLKSRRLPNKNFLNLGGKPLAYHIFESLSNVDYISEIYCYTSQPQVLRLLCEGIRLLPRPESLDSDNTKANELFRYAVQKVDADVIIICHATGPYISTASIQKGLNAVRSSDYDCALSVERHQTYCWYDSRPLNYDPFDMSQTQDLKPVLAETSGFYIFRKKDYLESGTRINGKPFFVDVSFKESIDIDEPKDFILASFLKEYDEKDTSSHLLEDSYFVNMANASMPYKNIEHLSFDLDGVLINSLPVMNMAWAAAMEKVSQNIPFSEYEKHIGIPFQDILDQLNVHPSDRNTVAQVYNAVSRENLEAIEVYPFVIDALKRVQRKGLKVSMVTSKNRERTAEIVREKLGSELFDIIITPEDVAPGRGKPNPDPLLLACVKMGVDPEKSIYVGDMVSDHMSAKRAGFHFVHAAWGYSDLDSVQELWFANCRDLVDYILLE